MSRLSKCLLGLPNGCSGSGFHEPGLVYTFCNSQPIFGPADYCLDVAGLARFEFDQHLGARDRGVPTQPILMAMAKDAVSGDYLWNMELWHEKMVRGAAAPRPRRATAANVPPPPAAVSATGDAPGPAGAKKWTKLEVEIDLS